MIHHTWWETPVFYTRKLGVVNVAFLNKILCQQEGSQIRWVWRNLQVWMFKYLGVSRCRGMSVAHLGSWHHIFATTSIISVMLMFHPPVLTHQFSFFLIVNLKKTKVEQTSGGERGVFHRRTCDITLVTGAGKWLCLCASTFALRRCGLRLEPRFSLMVSQQVI